MLSKFIAILFFNICCCICVAQTTSADCDCSANFGGVKGDNYLEINFSNVKIKDGCLYFSIKMKPLGAWRYSDDEKMEIAEEVLSSLDLRFTFNGDAFGSTLASAVPIEVVEYGMAKDGVTSWDKGFVGSESPSAINKPTSSIMFAVLNYTKGADRYTKLFRFGLYPDYVPIGDFRWKMQPGFTSGRTGVFLRIPTETGYMNDGTYPTEAKNSDEVGLGICVTGESLDIPVGGGTPAPTISKIEGPTPLCAGTQNTSYKATADDATAKFAWKVKKDGTDVTSLVVDGTLGDAATVAINWKPTTANGVYSVCATATNSTGTGNEKCFDVTINAAPALTLSEKDNKTSVCAGGRVNLVATSGLKNYKWSLNNAVIAGATANTYSPNVPTTGNLATYKVEAQSAAGCPASAELPITISPLPNVDITTIVANGDPRTAGTYGVGDYITMEANGADVSRYDYKWSDGIGPDVAGVKYDIASATAPRYDITLTVTDKVTKCTSSKTVSLTLDPTCGITNIALAGTDNNQICSGGICRLTANVTVRCGVAPVIRYEWYNSAGIKLDAVDVNNITSHTFTAKAPDTYTVKVYTPNGMKEASLMIKSRANIANKVDAPDNRSVQYGKTILLTAECLNASAWLWEPALLLEKNTQQYVQTKQMTAPRRFYVYVTDQNKCMSMDSTMVNISNDALVVDILPEKRPLVVCNKGTMTLTAKVSGGTSPYTYKWTKDIHTVNGTDEKQITIFKHNSITSEAQVIRRVVTVTDANNMTGLAMVDINVTATLEPNLSIDGGGTICEGAKLQVSNKNPGQQVSGYTWYIRDNSNGSIVSKSPTTPTTLTFDKRGDYYVWVAADAGSCTSDTTGKGVAVKVNGFDLAWSAQPANYKLGANILAEAQASNGATPYTFTWNALRAGSPVSVANANPNTYQVTGATENAYTFKVTAQDNNTCTKTIEAPVSGSLSGGLHLDLLANSAQQCNGGAVLMKATASGGSARYNFKWYKASDGTVLQTASLTGSPASNQLVAGGFSSGDKIVVKVTDDSSPALTRTDTVTISTLGTQAPVVYAGDDFRIGKGANTILFGETTSGVATEWNWADASDLASAAEASKQYPLTKNLTAQKEYTVYVKDAAGCYSMPDKVIVSVDNNEFSIAINDPLTICKGNTVNLKATPAPVGTSAVSWEWKEASGQLTGLTQESPVFAATTAGATTVYLKAKNAQGVVATASRKITVKDALAPVLKLDGLNADAVCSKAPLTVSSTNGIALVTSTWYLGANRVQSGTSMTYYPNVTEVSALNLKVEVTSDGAGCPAVNNIEKGITVFIKPLLAWGKSSTPALVMPGGEVKAVAKIKNSAALGSLDYTYVWTHAGSSVTYTDGGTTVSRVDSAISTANLGADGATTETQPYCFKAYAIDGNGCYSDTLSHSVGINGDALYVELKSVYGNYCVGGSALLKADVLGAAEENLNYAWFKNGVLISEETGRELLVANPNATDTYKVKATLKDATKSGESVVLQLVAGTNTAATLAGDVLVIPKGTKTALAVTSAGTAIESWQWSPVNKLAAGESTLRSPYTVELAADQDYKVYAVDENKCVTAPAEVKVTVRTIPKPGAGGEGDPDPGIFAYVYPTPSTICVGNVLNLRAVVWGDPTGGTTYEWSSEDHLTLTDGGAKALFETTAGPGTYSYTVKIKRLNLVVTMARVDITVVPGVLPDLAVNVDSTYKACAGSDLVLQVNNKNDVRIKKYTWIINNAVDPNVTGNRYTWPSVSVAKNFNVKVIAETEGHCASNMVTLDSLVKPALKLNPLQVVDSCGQVKLFSDAGSDATYSWSLKNAGLQLTDKKDTVYIKSKTAFTAASIPYDIAVSVSPKGGGCQSKGEITGKIYFQPFVKLEAWKPDGEAIGLPYMVTEKGSEPVVFVDKDSKYTLGTNAIENWSASAPTIGSGAAPNYYFIPGNGQAKIKDIRKDDTIRLIVANKEANKCISKDSMPIYLYPEAPKVDIDTNTCLTDIAIKWPSLSADSVRVWGIVEDAYNVNGGGYKLLASVKTNALKWIEPNMNERLKFYYLQSVKRIGGRSFASKVVSDTVGWLKQTVYGVNPSGILSSNNLIAYPFDMSAKGIRTDRDLYHKLLGKNAGNKPGGTGEWNFATQTWNLDSYVEFFGSMIWEGTETNLKAGQAYWLGISLSVPSVDMLMYGKLMRFTYDFEMNTTPGMTSTSYILYPLSMINNGKRQNLGEAIPSDFLGHYDIRSQVYDNVSYYEFFGSWMWDPVEADDTVLLNGWQPVRVLAKRKVLNWTK